MKHFRDRNAESPPHLRSAESMAVSFVYCFALAFGINAVIEFFSRRQIMGLLGHMVRNPFIFLYNTLIILFTLSVICLTKRRIFTAAAISATWIGMGMVNFVLRSFRVTPLSAVDFRLIKYGLSLADTYMSWIQITAIAVLMVIVVIGIIYLWRKAPKAEVKTPIPTSIGCMAALLILILGCTQAGLSSNMLAKNFGNIAEAYEDYGFAYCFTNSLINTGIARPKEYNEEVVEVISKKEILGKQIQKEFPNETEVPAQSETNKEMPNIIFVQLESFFDPALLKGVTFSKDPIPNYRALMDRYSTGLLNVPSVGAGTANTEFEILSGMNLDFFGPGEYPYKTILQKSTCESICFNLRDLDYATHAIHNNEGTFYDRHTVFSQLGFDTFTPVEYMNGVERNPTGWPKDDILNPEVIKALKSTEGRDFVYAISVQGHGAYPDEQILENPEITVNGGLEEEAARYQMEYYVNQLYEMDEFIGNLVKELDQMDEAYMLVLFGDHLPALGIADEDIENESIYQTRYVTCNNMDLPKADKDVEAYQLTAWILNQLKIHTGTIIRYHQNYFMKEEPDEEAYLTDMQVLEYDMLYGDYQVYGGTLPYEATELQMGMEEIVISRANYNHNLLTVQGKHFTEYSKVYVNEKPMDTIYVSSNTLLVKDEKLSGECEITVHQVGNDKVSLGAADSYHLYISKEKKEE